ncbi:hypothetical protein GCM10020295_67070 [Streptomyces cinereospinus]
MKSPTPPAGDQAGPTRTAPRRHRFRQAVSSSWRKPVSPRPYRPPATRPTPPAATTPVPLAPPPGDTPRTLAHSAPGKGTAPSAPRSPAAGC